MSAAGFDVAVIGAGVNGLVAGAYLAKAGRRVVILESRGRAGGLCEAGAQPAVAHALYALDPRVVRELKLARHGLAFAVRDMPLVGLRHDGRHIVLPREVHLAAQSVAIHSRADMEAYPRFRRALFDRARKMRRLWWDAGAPEGDEGLALMRRQSVTAFLDSWFESGMLKALLACDAIAGGLSPLEPGGALMLLWRAAQEMIGAQGAVALPKGGIGALATALSRAAGAAGAEVRTGAEATRILAGGGRVSGVELASGETIVCKAVLSSLPPRATLLDLARGEGMGFAQTAMLERADAPVAAAKIVFTLKAPPAFGGVAVSPASRFVLTESLPAMAAAEAAARSGRLPDELSVEAVMPTAADPEPGRHVLSAIVRPVPADPPEGWAALKAGLAARVVAMFERRAVDMARHVGEVTIQTPSDLHAAYGAPDETGGKPDAARMLAPWRSRIATPVGGLFLCGASAEPVGAVSGRAGRIAAGMLLSESAR